MRPFIYIKKGYTSRTPSNVMNYACRVSWRCVDRDFGSVTVVTRCFFSVSVSLELSDHVTKYSPSLVAPVNPLTNYSSLYLSLISLGTARNRLPGGPNTRLEGLSLFSHVHSLLLEPISEHSNHRRRRREASLLSSSKQIHDVLAPFSIAVLQNSNEIKVFVIELITVASKPVTL